MVRMTPPFLSLNPKIGGPVKYIKDEEDICLTKDQTRHIYKKVELESVVNVDTIEQEIEKDKRSTDIIYDDEVNPYHNITINNIDRENVVTSQMEQWLIFSSVVNYVQYERNPKNFYDLDIKAKDQKNHRKIYDSFKDEDRQVLELDFGNISDKLR